MAVSRQVPGASPDRPIVVGSANGDTPVQIVSTALVAGIRTGAIKWVTGDGVADLIERGAFVPYREGAVVEEPPPPPPPPAPEPVTVGTRIHEPNVTVDGAAAVVERPEVSARKFEWVKYAEAEGVDVDGLTKDQIVALFT
jgi:hypothetical protein